MDATVFLTDSLPQEITSGSFFCFRTKNIIINNTNWIMASSKDNALTRGIKTLLLEYWKNEKTAVHYFIFQILFDVMVENNRHLGELWQNVPVLYDDYYGLPFSKQSIKKNNMHKMNHRINYDSELLLKMRTEALPK